MSDEYLDANTSPERLAEIAEFWGLVFEDMGGRPKYVKNPSFRNHAHRQVYDLLAALASKDAEIAQLKADIITLGTQEAFNLLAQGRRDKEEVASLRALLLTQAQEVWAEAAKIADSRTKDRTRNEYESGYNCACDGLSAEFETRSRIPPSIGGEPKTHNPGGGS